MWTPIANFLSQEPVAIAAAVRLVLLAAMTFGLHLTTEQLVASMTALEAVLALSTRANVTPNASASSSSAGTVTKVGAWLLPFAFACLTIAGCASLPAKQKATLTLQSVETALGTAQDLERANHTALGLDAPATPAEAKLCTAPASMLVLPPNPTHHQVLGCLFAVAFDGQNKASIALQAWQAGQTPPTFVAELKDETGTLFTFAQGVVHGQQAQAILEHLKSAVDTALSVYQLVGGVS
jgi:hypothetical protein